MPTGKDPNEKLTYKQGDEKRLIKDLGLNRKNLRELGLVDKNDFIIEITKEITLTRQKLAELKKQIKETILEDITRKSLFELASLIKNFALENNKSSTKTLGKHLNISIQDRTGEDEDDEFEEDLSDERNLEEPSDEAVAEAYNRPKETQEKSDDVAGETQKALDRQERELRALNLDGNVESQQQPFGYLKSGLSNLILTLSKIEGVNYNDLLDYNNFRKIYEAYRPQLNYQDTVIGDKVVEILEKPYNNLLQKELIKDWGSSIKGIVQKANGLMNDFLESTKKGMEGMDANKLFQVMKAHPYISTVVGVGGAVGLYKIFGFLFRKKKKKQEVVDMQDEEGMSTWKKWLYGMGAVLIAIFALGKLSGLQAVIDFAQKFFGIDLNKYKIVKIIRCLSNLDIQCAMREILPEKTLTSSRAAILLTKARYYHNKYARYVNTQRKTANVPLKRLEVLETLQRDKNFAHNKGLLDRIIEVEKKGGIDKLLDDLKKETNPQKKIALERQIQEYYRNLQDFDLKFDTFVRQAKHRKPDKILENPEFKKACERFESNELREAELTRQSHEIAKKRDAEIERLKQTEKDPKKLAEKVKQVREKFIREIGQNKEALRTLQSEMISDLKTISAKESDEARKFLQKHKDKIKTKKLPTGKLGFVLIGGLIGHELLTGESDLNQIALTGAEAVGGFVPFVNMGLDLNQIITGKNLAGDDISFKERFLMAPAFLVLDTAGSLATATGIGSVVGLPLLAASNAAKVARSAKAMKAARQATKLARTAGKAEGVISEARAVEILRDLKTYLGDLGITAKHIMAVPSKTMFQFQESLKFAKTNGIIKNMGTASKLANFTVWSNLGVDVYTCFKEVGFIEVNDDSHPLLKTVDTLAGAFNEF